MSNYQFPGYPRFLEVAAEQIGHTEAVSGARRITALTALANLCAQAAEADEDRIDAILQKANEFRNQLSVAFLASEHMLNDVRRGRQSVPNSKPEEASKDDRTSHSKPCEAAAPRRTSPRGRGGQVA
ncbi:hypothetical protein BH23PLA1_BH23PLA1_29550 [soil metagenome]